MADFDESRFDRESEEYKKNAAMEPFGGEEALALARQGKDAWNKWAQKNPGRRVNFSVVAFETDANFNQFLFPGEAMFHDATFSGDAWFHDATFNGGAMFFGAAFSGDAGFVLATFSGYAEFFLATFSGDAGFFDATFSDDARFDDAVFSGDAGFFGATFEKTAMFQGTTFLESGMFTGGRFNGPVTLKGATFHRVPDFRLNTFKQHVTLHGVKVDYADPPDEDDEDKFRRLKELAAEAKDHDREQEFFACELKAKRYFEESFFKRLPIHLYEVLSDFGRSLRRPAMFLVALWLGCGIAYNTQPAKDYLVNALTYSAGALLPFLPFARHRMVELEQTLFGDKVPAWVSLLTIAEGIMGAVLIFLLGLALRNRFRI